MVFAIQETRYSEYTVAIAAGWVATKGSCDLLEYIFLTHQVEAAGTPKSLIPTGRCGKDHRRSGYEMGGADSRHAGIAVRVEVDVDMTYRCDALLRTLFAAHA
jgi:hypothetical protein